MPPKKSLGEELDLRTDIFSLGSTWYHMLAGSAPFDGIKEDPISLQQLNPEISNATCTVVNKMMAKKREERYQSFAELLTDLELLEFHPY